MKSIHQLLQDSSSDVPVVASLEHALNDAILGEDLSLRNSRKASQHYTPSGMNCLRAMYFRRSGADKDSSQSRSSNQIGILESGSDRHLRIQAALIKMSLKSSGWKYWDVSEYVDKYKPKGIKVMMKIGNETLCFNSNYGISFMCDGILEYKGVFYVLEIKTESNDKSLRRVGIDKSHIYQGCCYSFSFGIKEVIYIYENRNDCKKKYFKLLIKDSLVKEVISRIETVESCLVKNKAPQEFPEDLKLCTWCEYQSVCSAHTVKKTANKIRGRNEIR